MNPFVTASSLFGASAVGAAIYAWTVFRPESQVWLPVMRTLHDPTAVALTFDDGPTEPFTSEILDILRERKAHATFFVIGQNVAKFPHLLKRMREEGHTIGNHTMHHHHHGVMHFEKYWRRELVGAGDLIFAACGERPLWFRPPMGFKTPFQAAAVRSLRLRAAGWNRRAFDTRTISPHAIADAVTAQLKGGDVIMLHDGVEPARAGQSQRETVAALPLILDAIAARGLRCVALPSS